MVTGSKDDFENGWDRAIRMKILFATVDYFPARGGLQASVDKLIHWLKKRGHSCAVLVSAVRRDMIRPKTLAKGISYKLFKRPFFTVDRTFPYPVYRTKNPLESLSIARRIFNPDILVCVVGGSHTIDFAKMLCKTAGDLPSLIYIFDIEGVAFTADPLYAKSHVVANADVIASLIADHRLRPPVVPCIVDSIDCRVESTREVVLYINPHPRKGVNLAWAIAEAAKDLKFVFQESWRLNEKRRMEAINRAQNLENVEFRSAIDRPAEIYRDARVLLAPYGPERPRVIDEAQASGIPVVASDVPGLNESVGKGGVLVDPEGPIDAWASVLERLQTDEVYYKGLVDAAFRHSKRPEIQPEYLTEIFEHELRYAVEHSKA
jgi:glycosyltransferase involved in cell wall biosynthesis